MDESAVPVAADYFTLESSAWPPRSPGFSGWLKSLGRAALQAATLDLWPATAVPVYVRVRSQHDDIIVYEWKHSIETRQDLDLFEQYKAQLRDRLGSQTPREFATQLGIAWPPDSIWR